MSETHRLALVALTDPEGVVTARRVARDAATALGFPEQDRTRIATAVSELARNAFQYARGGRLVVELEDGALVCRVVDDGPGIIDLRAVLGREARPGGAGHGLLGVQRLSDDFDLTSSPAGTVATFSKRLGAGVEVEVAALRQRLQRRIAADAQEELEHQNRELLAALSALRARQDELEALNRELDDTNRGVVALHHELDQQAARDRTISRLLQRSLMPEVLLTVPGVALHAAHRSAGGSLVGGDFYDVIDVGHEELWLVMGDVAGHGVETAAKANELRQSLRVYAREGYRPEEAFGRLNELVLADDLVGLASACLMLLRPRERTAETIIAGHPAPLLVPAAPGAAPALLEAERGPVMGIPGTRWTPHVHRLGPGDRVVLYTDGLVERVGEPLSRAFERLLAAGADFGDDDGPAILDRLFELPDAGPLRDDVAVLTARLEDASS